MKDDALVASGGFAPPNISFELTGLRITRLPEERSLWASLPSFSAVRGGIDFSPTHVRWARKRERELRALTRMWDWP